MTRNVQTQIIPPVFKAKVALDALRGALSGQQIAGEMAERKARADLEADGYDVVEFKEGNSQAGIEVVAVKYDDTGQNIVEMKVVEVTSTQFSDANAPDVSLDSRRQRGGGASHLETMLDDIEYNDGVGSNKYGTDITSFAEQIRNFQNRGGTLKFEIQRYRVDMFSGEVSKIGSTDWLPNKSKYDAGDFRFAEGETPRTEILDRNPAIEAVLDRHPNSYQDLKDLRGNE